MIRRTDPMISNADGTIHDKGKGAPEWSNKVVKWLRNYGFNI